MQLELKFLGRGSAFNPACGNTNAYFEIGGDLFFLDFGESAFSKAVKHLRLESRNRIVVLLTHLHADHAGSLASLISYSYCVLGKQVLLVHPVDTVVEMLRLQGIAASFYEYRPALPEDYPVRAEALEVDHAPDMRCFGYFLYDQEHRIFYSGDTSRLHERVREALLAGELDRVYHDVASHESASHCYVQRILDAVPKPLLGRIHAMHLDSDCADGFRNMGLSVVEVACGPQ